MKKVWKSYPFEHCLEAVPRTTKLPSSKYLEKGAFPVVSQEDTLISGYWDNEEDVLRIAHPIVIFGDHTRIIKYIDFDFVIGADGVKVLSPIDELVPKFFYYYLKWLDVPSLGYSRHYKLLKETSVPVPPLPEQERIVAELDLLSGIIDKYKQQLKELDTLAQSIFYDMFSSLFETEHTITLKDVAQYYIGLTYKPEDVSSEGTIVLRSSNIQNNQLDFNDIVRVNTSIDKKKLVEDGDILMCARNGSAKLVGKVARIVQLKEPMSFGAFMTIIRSQNNDFLFHFFISDFFKSQLTTSKTATINQITTRMLDGIKLNVPTPSLQQSFADQIKAIEAQKESVKQAIKETETLFNSRMDYYFN